MAAEQLDPNTQFYIDYNQLGTDSESFAAAQQKQATDKAAYNTQYDAIQQMIADGTDPEIVLLALLSLIMNQGMDEMDDQMAVDGSALQIDSDLTACNNDIQADIDGGASLEQVASEQDAMMAVLNPDGDPNAPSWSTSTQSAIGSTASDSLYESYGNMRSEIYIVGDDEYNPPDESSTTVYFSNDPNQNGTNDPAGNETDPNQYKLGSFSEMTTDMATQGDPKQATEAAQGFTNASNMNSSTTGTLQSAAEVEVQWLTQEIQLISTFGQDLMQEMVDTEKASITNQTR